MFLIRDFLNSVFAAVLSGILPSEEGAHRETASSS